MLVYNVKRQWFTMKDAAERYRVQQGLKPGATIAVRVDDRVDLTMLLNALCEPGKVASTIVAETNVTAVIDRAYVEPTKDVPLFVPAFLIADPELRKRQEERLAGMSVAELERALKED